MLGLSLKRVEEQLVRFAMLYEVEECACCPYLPQCAYGMGATEEVILSNVEQGPGTSRSKTFAGAEHGHLAAAENEVSTMVYGRTLENQRG